MKNPNDRLAVLMYQFIVDKGLRDEWNEYFEEQEPPIPYEDLCPDCMGAGEHISGGSFGGPTMIHKCFSCRGTGRIKR